MDYGTEKIIEQRMKRINSFFCGRDLILGGGGAKGIFQIGVMRSLWSVQAKFNRIYGNSVGGINGVGYGFGVYDDLLKEWMDVLDGKQEFYTKGFLGIGWIPKSIFGSDGAFNNKNLRKLIERHYKIDLVLSKDFPYGQPFVDVVDIKKGDLFHVTINQNAEVCLYQKSKTEPSYVLGRKYWTDFVLATTCIPIAFTPVKIKLGNGRELQLVDGGVRNIVPTGFPISIGCKKMLIILNTPIQPKESDTRNNILEIGLRSLTLNTNEIYNRDIKIMQLLNDNIEQTGKHFIDYYVIEPDFTLEDSLSMDRNAMEELYKHGINKGKEFINSL